MSLVNICEGVHMDPHMELFPTRIKGFQMVIITLGAEPLMNLIYGHFDHGSIHSFREVFSVAIDFDVTL